MFLATEDPDSSISSLPLQPELCLEQGSPFLTSLTKSKVKNLLASEPKNTESKNKNGANSFKDTSNGFVVSSQPDPTSVGPNQEARQQEEESNLVQVLFLLVL